MSKIRVLREGVDWSGVFSGTRPHPKRRYESICKWCEQPIITRNKRARNVCMDWVCQNKDVMEIRQNNEKKAREAKEKRRQ